MLAHTMLRVACISLWLLLTSCGGDKADSAITIWVMGREGEVIKSLTSEYERRHPGMDIRVQQIPWSAAHEKLLTAFAGNALPDIIQLGNTWIPEFAALDAIAPIGGLDAEYPDFFPGILASSLVDGRLMAMPWYVDTRLLFYRKDILARAGFWGPPATWSEWVAMMQRIKAVAGKDEFPLLLPTNEWQVPVILGLQAGSGLLRDNNQYGDFEKTDFARAFSFYLDFYRQGFAPLVAQSQLTNLYQEFALGRFAFFITGPWNIGEFRQRLPASIQPLWDTAVIPGPAGPGVSLAGGASLALCRTSRNPEVALQLIRYLTATEGQLALYRQMGDLPARRSVWLNPDLQAAPHAGPFLRQLDAVRPTPQIPEWEHIAALIALYGEKAARGELDESQALKHLNSDVNQILAKRRWLNKREQQGQDGQP